MLNQWVRLEDLDVDELDAELERVRASGVKRIKIVLRSVDGGELDINIEQMKKALEEIGLTDCDIRLVERDKSLES